MKRHFIQFYSWCISLRYFYIHFHKQAMIMTIVISRFHYAVEIKLFSDKDSSLATKIYKNQKDEELYTTVSLFLDL